MIDDLKKIKEELTIALEDSDDVMRAKFQKSIILIDNLLYEASKKELFIEAASNILHRLEYNIEIIQEEYSDGDVWFEYYVAAHDYSAGRSSYTIKKQDIEIEIRDNTLSKLLSV
jgi:hypothetical protein